MLAVGIEPGTSHAPVELLPLSYTPAPLSNKPDINQAMFCYTELPTPHLFFLTFQSPNPYFSGKILT